MHSSAQLVNPVSKVTATDNSALDSTHASNIPVVSKQECGIIALKAHFLNKGDTVTDSSAAPCESEIH